MPIRPTVHPSIWYRASETARGPVGAHTWVRLTSRGRGHLITPGHAPVVVSVISRRGRRGELEVRVRPSGPTPDQTPVCPTGTEVCGDPTPGNAPPCCPIKVQGPTPAENPFPYAQHQAQLQRSYGNPPVAGVGSFAALPPAGPDLSGCCIDIDTRIIYCPGGEAQWYMHGREIPAAAMSLTGDGQTAIITTGDARIILPICESPNKRTPPPDEPPPPPPQIPSDCCYDAARAVLSCSDADVDGMAVALVSMFVGTDGNTYAIVTGEQIAGQLTVPLCEEQVPNDCCYDTQTGLIRCTSSSDYEGKAAGVVTTFTGPDGTPWVSLSWPGGGARMPVCNEPCPGFCCINVESSTWVCPEDPTRNGQPVQVEQVVNDGGYRWAQLQGGGRVPVCGSDCPPPRLCPDCPGCPPGMWMSPDGSCTDPPPCEECPPPVPCKHPTCPPGWLLDTQSGRCVQCPPGWVPPPPEQCPPWWELGGHCCENCALDEPCAGPEGGCNCGGEHGPQANPCDNPDGTCALAVQSNPLGKTLTPPDCPDGMHPMWIASSPVPPARTVLPHWVCVPDQFGMPSPYIDDGSFNTIGGGPITRPGAIQQGTGMTPGASLEVRGNPEQHVDAFGNLYVTSGGSRQLMHGMGPGSIGARKHEPCVAYVEGTPRLFFWKGGVGHGPSYSTNPVEILEQNGVMLHIVASPSGSFPDGFDGWVKRCPEYDQGNADPGQWFEGVEVRVPTIGGGPITRPGAIQQGTGMQPGASLEVRGNPMRVSSGGSRTPVTDAAIHGMRFGDQQALFYAPYWSYDPQGWYSTYAFSDPSIIARARLMRGGSEGCWLENDARGQIYLCCEDACVPVPMTIGRRGPISAAVRHFRRPRSSSGPYCYVREIAGAPYLCCIDNTGGSFCVPLPVAAAPLTGRRAS